MSPRGDLGRLYKDGEIVIREGEVGDSLFVIQSGEVEILTWQGGEDVLLRVAGPDELIGEMALFEHQVRSATVRARGPAHVLTLDRRNFLRRINEDPSLAFRILEVMSHRVRDTACAS